MFAAADREVDIESGSAGPEDPAEDGRQAALDEFMGGLESEATYYSYPSLVRYLSLPCGPGAPPAGDLGATLERAAVKLCEIAGGEVYLADGRAFTPEGLEAEFPELRLFRLKRGDAFARARGPRPIWVETRRFADLRSLSGMRREIRRTGVAPGADGLELVRALLGLPADP